MRNHFRPLPGLVFRRLKQCKIGSAPEVASNPPARSVVARRILQAGRPRHDALKIPKRFRGREEPYLIHIGGRGRNHQVLLGFTAVDRTAKRLVHLVKDQRGLTLGVQGMAPNLVHAQRHGILCGVKKRTPVVGPRKCARRVRDFHCVLFAGCDFTKPQRVLPTAHKIHGVGHALVVAGHYHRGNLAVGLALSQRVHVHHELLISLLGTLKAHVNGILFAFLVAGLVPVAVHLHRNRCLVRIQTPRHLRIKQVDQRL